MDDDLHQLTEKLRRGRDKIAKALSDTLVGRTDELLKRIADLRAYIKPDGAIWVVRRKGAEATLKEVDVINAGLAAHLVDNKIASFSDTHGAMRLVFRLRDRPK